LVIYEAARAAQIHLDWETGELQPPDDLELLEIDDDETTVRIEQVQESSGDPVEVGLLDLTRDLFAARPRPHRRSPRCLQAGLEHPQQDLRR
jgi:hypothetical protein